MGCCMDAHNWECVSGSYRGLMGLFVRASGLVYRFLWGKAAWAECRNDLSKKNTASLFLVSTDHLSQWWWQGSGFNSILIILLLNKQIIRFWSQRLFCLASSTKTEEIKLTVNKKQRRAANLHTMIWNQWIFYAFMPKNSLFLLNLLLE